MMSIGVLSGLDDQEALMAENPHMILENIKEMIRLF
jgi:hypothetical protein